VASRTRAEVATLWAASAAAQGVGDLDPPAQLAVAYAGMRVTASPANRADYAQAAIGKRLPFFGEEGVTNLGVAGWCQWRGIGNGADDTATVVGSPAGLEAAAASGQWHG
jgi:hypothetical protein